MIFQEKFREIAYRSNGLSYPPKPRSPGLPRPMRRKWNSLEELSVYLRDFGGRLKYDDEEREGFLVAMLEDEHFDISKGVLRPPVFAEVPMEFAMRVVILGMFP